MKTIRDGRTLRALARAGYIKEPAEMMRPKGAKWGSGYSYVDADLGKFSHKGNDYKIENFSGCFFPFVIKTN